MAEARDMVIIIAGSLLIIGAILFTVIGFILYLKINRIIKNVKELTENAKEISTDIKDIISNIKDIMVGISGIVRRFTGPRFMFASNVIHGVMDGIGVINSIFRRKKKGEKDGKQ